jgi:hypothetical protein
MLDIQKGKHLSVGKANYWENIERTMQSPVFVNHSLNKE